MAEAIRRNILLVLGVAIAGVLFAMASRSLLLNTGASGSGILASESSVVAAVLIVVCLVIAMVIAGVVGRMTNTAVGMFVLGAGIFILANRSGTYVDLAFAEISLGTLITEALLWSVAILGLTLGVFALAGPLKDIEPEPSGRRPHWLLSREAMISAAAGALVLPVVWFVAQSPMKGQVVAATILGSLVAGLAGRLVSPHVQPKLLFPSVLLFATVGYIIAIVKMQGAADAAYVNATVSPWLLPMPVDYAAGALLGVSMGLGWAKSFLHHEEVPAPPK